MKATTRINAETKAHAQRAAHNGRKAAESLYDDTSHKVANLYKEGKKAVSDAQDSVLEYGDELAITVQKHPFSSLLIAGGIGFIISALFKK